jgi:flagellar protein FlbD
MIPVTRLDGKELVVNAEQILLVEATPDTVLTLAGGVHLMVKERPDVIVDLAVAYRRRCLAPDPRGKLVPLPRPAPRTED